LVSFVEEQYHVRASKCKTVHNIAEKFQGLLEAICLSIFRQNLVVFACGSEKKHGGDVIEAYYPFLTVMPLPTHVHKYERDSGYFCVVFRDPTRDFSRA
jgi:hypothetical protein